ncbi:uncharacterized protein LOC144102440 [Amblyomma americanum]
MGHIGYIEPFEETTSDWRSCEERLKAYLSVNDVPVAKKVPAFLSLIGAKTYALLKSLTAPDAPSLREFDSLLKLLSDHLAPQSSVIAERAKFYKRSQRSGGSLQGRTLVATAPTREAHSTRPQRNVFKLKDVWDGSVAETTEIHALCLNKFAIQKALPAVFEEPH